MTKSLAIIIGLILLAALMLFSMTYTVNFHEVAIKTRFGQVDGENSIVRTPGLKFRLPLFMDKVTTFDTRLQLRENPLETVQTTDGQQVVVRAYLMWKVREDGDGPLKFFESYSTVEEANAAIGDQFKTAMRSGLSRFAFDDLIGDNSRRAEAEAAITNEMASVRSKGIEPVNVGVTQLVLPPRTAQAVLDRMKAGRTVLSETERFKGQAEASALQNRAKAQADKIRAFADQRAAEIRAEGEQDAAKYYALMSEAQDLAVFLQWLDALKTSLSQYTTVVLPSSFAPLHLLNLDSATDRHGIPQPATTQPDIAGTSGTPAGMSMNTQPSGAKGPNDG